MDDVPFQDPRGPVEELDWGKFVIRGEEHSKSSARGVRGVGKNIFVHGSSVLAWPRADDREERHAPSVKTVTDPLPACLDVLVVGSGIRGRVQLSDECLEALASTGVREVIVRPTPEACRLFNDLYHQGRDVALLAHGTC